MIYGNITGVDYSSIVGISSGTNCCIYGNINGPAVGIDDSTDCAIYGNMQGDGITGIAGGSGNNINGNLTANDRTIAEGISNGSHNCIRGNIKSSFAGDYGFAYGINEGTNCAIYGSITVSGDNHSLYANVYGISGGSKNYISGSIRVSKSGNPKIPMLTVSAGSPYQGYFECDYDGSGSISNEDIYGEKHCEYTNDYGYICYGCYKCCEEVYYNNGKGSDSDVDDPSSVIPEPMPTQAPASYDVRIINELSDEPMADARVFIDGKEYITDSYGVIQIKNAPRTGGIRVEYGGSVVYTAADFHPIPNQMNTVIISPIDINVEDFDFGNPGSDKVYGPPITINGKKYPAFELPGSIDVSYLDTLKVAYDADEKSWKVIFGGSEKDFSEIKEGKMTPAFMKKLEEIKKFKEDADKGKLNPDKFFDRNSTKEKDMGWKANFAASGYIELKLSENGEMLLSNAGMIVAATVGMDGTLPVPSMPIVYATYSLSGSLQGGINISLDKAEVIDPKMKMTGNIDFEVSPSLGAGVGAQKVAALEMGLNGTIGTGVNFPFVNMPTSFKAELSADYYFLLRLLAWDFRYSHTFLKWQMYPPQDIELMSVDEGDLRPIGRDYLNAEVSAAADEDTIKQNIYPYSDAKSVLLNDGSELMVWIDDDPARNDINRTALMYSVCRNGAWSEPSRIENDGTADFDFDLRTDGYKAAVVWQDANAPLSNDAELEQMAASLELSYAVFDGQLWSEPITVTSGNTDYEYNPTLYFGDTSYVVWTQNNLNSLMPGVDDTKESIYRAMIQYKKSEIASEKLCGDLPFVYGAAVDCDGNAAYLVDADGDISTPENKYCVNGKSYGGDTVLTGLDYSNGSFVFTETGELKTAYANGSQPVTVYSKGGENIKYLGDAVVFEMQNGFASDLYASYIKNGDWTNPVKITDYDEKIRAWDAHLGSDGNIIISAVLAKITIGNDNVSDIVRLVHTADKPIEDIEVRSVWAEGDVEPGQTASFVVAVSNNTMSDITSANITLNSTDTTLFDSESEVILKAGEVGYITINAEIPNNFRAGNITASVSAPNIVESDPDNNSASASVGETKLNLEIKGNKIFGGGYAEAVIENTGCDDAPGTELIVTGENGENIYSEKIDIAGGETKKVKIQLDEKYYTFGGENEGCAITAKALFGGKEASDTYRIKPQSVKMIRVENSSIALTPGSTHTVKAEFYPEGTAADLYLSSDNEKVAAVDGNGTITAVSCGEAVISVSAPGAAMSAKVRVYVRESSAPTVTNAEYTQYEENYGELRVSVDTTGCLSAGEKETLMIAAYGEDGTLAGFTTLDVTGAAPAEDGTTPAGAISETSVPISGAKPKKVKVMIWNSTKNIMPVSEPAEKEL